MSRAPRREPEGGYGEVGQPRGQVATIRSGFLVSLKTECAGGVEYVREDLLAEERDGANVAEWKTRRVIDDPEEYERAKRARSKARSLVSKVCVHTNFGLLCPLDREAELDEAVREARRTAAEHNATAGSTRLSVYVIKGRIAGTDEEAARSIISEVRGLVEQMGRGIDEMDVEKIRDAASRAREMRQMLPEDQAGRVSAAVAQARSAARIITKRAGEDPKVVLLDVARGDIERARMAFIDMSDDPPPEPARIAPADERMAYVEMEGGSDAV